MMTQTPVEVMGLNTKGKIENGFDAQFAVFNKYLQIVG